MADIMFQVIQQDRIQYARSTLKSFCSTLRKILREKIYQENEIDEIKCYLLRNVYAHIDHGMFRIYYENNDHVRVLLGVVSTKRAFMNEILVRYERAIAI